MNQLTVSLLTRVWLAVPYVALSGVLSAQQGHPTMRQYVAGQALTEVALRTGSTPARIPTAATRLEKAAGIVEGLDLWRATLPSDHSHPYLLATIRGEVVRLGGFTAPELGAVAPQLVHGRLDAKIVRTVSEQLALLADPNGALQWVYTEKADQPGYVSIVAMAWRKRASKDWPRDTVIATEVGWMARLTLLSRDTRSYTLHWVPLAFSFEFDRDGRLIAWAQRMGEVFGVAGVPLPATAGKQH